MIDIPPLDRCHWAYFEDGSAALIPGCMGAAVHGPEQCTCDVTGSRLERAEEGRRIAEEHVARLLAKAERRQDYIETLLIQHRAQWRRIRELEAG